MALLSGWGGERSSPLNMAFDYKDVCKSLSCLYSIVSFKYRSASSVTYNFLII